MLRFVAPCALSALFVVASGASIGLAAPLLGSTPAPAMGAAPAPVVVPQKLDHNRFRLEFDAAVKQGSNKKMDLLMERMQTEAIFAILDSAEAISNGPNDVLYDRFNGLRESWRRVKENDFPDQLELYFVNLTQAEKKVRRKIKREYDKMGRGRVEAENARDLPTLLAYSNRYEEVADAFAQIGDQWYESDSRLAAATLGDEAFHKKKTDYFRVTKLYVRAMELRDELGVKDYWYRVAHPRMKILLGLGFGEDALEDEESEDSEGSGEGGDAAADDVPKKPVGPVPDGEVLTTKLTFKALKGLKDDKRPNYYLDEHRQIWPSLALGAVGSAADIPRLGANGPRVMRLGDSKVGVDLDRDGKSDMEWPARGKLDAVTMELGEGESKRTWSVLAEVGRSQDLFQGIQMNLAQTGNQMTLYYLPGGSMVGKLGGVSVELFDDNFDGAYGSAASSWAHRELVPKGTQPDVDSIRIDGRKQAQPMSQFVQLGKAGWHKLTVENSGTSIKAEPYTFKTGTLQLKTKGTKPAFVIVKGSGSVHSETYIDISGGKKVEVPAGRWELFYGLLRSGKKMQLVKAAILPSDATPSYDVKAGKNLVVTMGAPYTFDFSTSKQQNTIKVTGMSVRVIGAGGEAYDRFYGSVPRPLASVRKKGSKRASGSEKMRPGVSPDDIDKYGWHQLWKPLDVMFPSKGAEMEIQLFEKKNKLFGAVESAWL